MQVFFVCSDAAIFSLCPVAPFHAPVSESVVEHLLEGSQHQQGNTTQSTTRAWLAQVGSASVDIAGMLLCLSESGCQTQLICASQAVHCTMLSGSSNAQPDLHSSAASPNVSPGLNAFG